VESRPLYKITVASGKTSITLTAAWTQGSATRLMTITVTGLTGGSTYYIDSDALEVYNANRTDLLTKNSGGTFPVLGPGNNVITFTNIASVEITKRERFL
jgi:phage-related protein